MIVALTAAAVLLGLAGLLWPERLNWLKWPVRIVGALGTLFVALLVWALSITGRMAGESGGPITNWDYVFGSLALLFCFWSPAFGLGVGRFFGRLFRRVGRDCQETHL